MVELHCPLTNASIVPDSRFRPLSSLAKMVSSRSENGFVGACRPPKRACEAPLAENQLSLTELNVMKPRCSAKRNYVSVNGGLHVCPSTDYLCRVGRAGRRCCGVEYCCGPPWQCSPPKRRKYDHGGRSSESRRRRIAHQRALRSNPYSRASRRAGQG